MLGIDAGELQSGITVTEDGVYGTLNYITGYTGFSGNASEQSGHYIALKMDTDDDDDVITVELTNGSVGHPITLDSDRNIVIRITDPSRQKIIVIASHTEDGTTTTEKRVLRLADLTLEPET